MYYTELSDGVKHFKETEKGRGIMCERFEALEMGLTQEDAKKLSGITEEQMERLLCAK